MNKRVVLFDMDGTLVHIPLTVTEFIQQTLQKLGLSYTLGEVTMAWQTIEDQLWKGRLSDFTLRTHNSLVESNRLILEQLGVTGNLHNLAERMQFHWDNLPEEADEQLYPEVNTVLQQLTERDVIIGVLSARLVNLSLRSLEYHGIHHFFQYIIGPKMAGAPNAKLSPEMWTYAAEKVHATPEEILHVDNEYDSGIIGAKNAGVTPVLIDRQGTYTGKDCITIRDLTGLLDYLD